MTLLHQSVFPRDLQPGDEFTDRRGRRVRVVRADEGRYSSYKVLVEVLSRDVISIDYIETVDVERPAS